MSYRKIIERDMPQPQKIYQQDYKDTDYLTWGILSAVMFVVFMAILIGWSYT